jgi:hypothetical protein
MATPCHMPMSNGIRGSRNYITSMSITRVRQLLGYYLTKNVDKLMKMIFSSSLPQLLFTQYETITLWGVRIMAGLGGLAHKALRGRG